jgi:HJR/Mrr/RecB family endonuclease
MASLLAASRRSNPLTTLDREVAETTEDESSSELPSGDHLEVIRANLLQITPVDFEHFIKSVMERSGFVSVSVTKASGDGGIDLDAYVEEANDFFGGTHVQAQVKRWRHAMGVLISIVFEEH